MVRMLVYVVPVALTIYGLVDLARSQPVERAGLRPLLWVLIMLVPVLGPLTWLFVSRSQRSAQGRERRTSADRRTAGFGPAFDRRRGPVAPDDDPEFLWRLAQQQRRAQRPPTPPTDQNRRATDRPETTTDESGERAGEDARDESES